MLEVDKFKCNLCAMNLLMEHDVNLFKNNLLHIFIVYLET